MAAEFHISSLIVRVRPERVAGVRRLIEAKPGAEVHAERHGKMIVTLETGSTSAIVEHLKAFSLLEGVLSAVLVFHHVEPAAGPEGVPPC